MADRNARARAASKLHQTLFGCPARAASDPLHSGIRATCSDAGRPVFADLQSRVSRKELNESFSLSSGQARARLVQASAALATVAAWLPDAEAAYRPVVTPINPSGPRSAAHVVCGRGFFAFALALRACHDHRLLRRHDHGPGANWTRARSLSRSMQTGSHRLHGQQRRHADQFSGFSTEPQEKTYASRRLPANAQPSACSHRPPDCGPPT